MDIIEPEPKYVHEFTALIERFYEEGIDHLDFGYRREDAEHTYYMWIARRHPGLLLRDGDRIVGCIGGIITPHILDYSTLYFNEFVWYVLPEYRNKGAGIRLLRAMERRCEERGVKKMAMTASAWFMPDYFDQMFARLGYKKLETKYIKDV